MFVDFLPHGKENAIPARKWAQLFACSQSRVYSWVKSERQAGRNICACRSGYYLP